MRYKGTHDDPYHAGERSQSVRNRCIGEAKDVILLTQQWSGVNVVSPKSQLAPISQFYTYTLGTHDSFSAKPYDLIEIVIKLG